MKLQASVFKDPKNPFGLFVSQMRSPGAMLIHNAGWYNVEGFKLGWGDLDRDDFSRIQANLDPGELFVILDETASFWNFVDKIGHLGSLCSTSPQEKQPGKEYLGQNARFIISKDQIIYVDEWFKEGASATERNILGIKFGVISREKCLAMLGAQNV